MPTKQTILVIGGAGFIGSHMVLALRDQGFKVVVLDNLCNGHRDAVLHAELIVGEMRDKKILSNLFSTYHFDAVMHFAALIDVADSVKNPTKYYQNNLADTLILLDQMVKHGIKKIVFSSTAAVYGDPSYTPIDESHPQEPINPYGRSKWMVEEIIKDFAKSDELHYAILRYFNAAGADEKARIGERHQHESHLIPLVLQTALGLRKKIIVYGDDYPTKDGSCIRDYVHVTDLCHAHLLALQKLLNGESSLIANLGTGKGYSVLDVIDSASRITKCEIPVEFSDRREGDPSILIADAKFAKQFLAWQPRYADLDVMIQHAWNFMRKKNPR